MTTSPLFYSSRFPSGCQQASFSKPLAKQLDPYILSVLLLYSNELTSPSWQALQPSNPTGTMPSGTIPDSRGYLHNLTVLGLAFLNLTGTKLPRLGELVQLNYLNLMANQLTGTIPTPI